MGNNIGTQCEPIGVDELIAQSDEPKKDEAKPDNFEEFLIQCASSRMFQSVLLFWEFFPDRNDELFVQNRAISLSNFFGFNDESCYMALHVYLNEPFNKSLEQTEKNLKRDPDPEEKIYANQVSIVELAVSAKQQLSPRGQSTAFGGYHHSIGSSFHDSKSKSVVLYDIYIWYGKEASNLVKANTLAKGFDLDGALKSSRSKVQSMFHQSDTKYVTLSSLLHFEHNLSPTEWKSQISGNHLFTTISKYYEPKKLKKPKSSKKNPVSLERNSSSKIISIPPLWEKPSDSPSFEPKNSANKSKSSKKSTNNSRTSKKGKLAALQLHHLNSSASNLHSGSHKSESSKHRSSKLVSRKHETSVDHSSASKKQDDHLRSKLKLSKDFRSVSMPLAQISGTRPRNSPSGAEPKRKIEGLNLGSLPQVLEPEPDLNRVMESKASKIARYDYICSQITDSLFLASDRIARDLGVLKSKGITHILNCAGAVCDNYHPSEFIYKRLFLCDGLKENISCLFYDVLEFMDDAIRNNGRVMVHCHQGISRSSAMVILYLMWKEHRPFQETHERVKQLREIANPNPGFTCQLLNWWSERTAGNWKTKLFYTVPHCMNSPDLFALKEIPRKPSEVLLSPDSLDTRGCYLIWTANELFLWRGNTCPEFLFSCGILYGKRLVRFERAPSILRVEEQGKESTKFQALFSEDGNSLGAIDARAYFDDSYGLLSRVTEPPRFTSPFSSTVEIAITSCAV